MKKISYSQWTTWKRCSHFWKLKYVDGPRIDDASIDTLFGTCMHEVIQDWLTDVFTKSEKYANNQDRSEAIKTKLMDGFKTNTILTEDGQSIFLCDKPTLIEYYQQGLAIMSYVQQYRAKIFPTKNVILLGIEIELSWELKPGIFFQGFLDVVTENTDTGRITIHDLKTSKAGWNDYAKKDPVKIAQLLLYKRFYAKMRNIPESMIDVEYLILKRNIVESTEFHIPRVSKFVPANGTPSVNKAHTALMEFVDACFNEDGSYNVSKVEPNPSKNNCRFCPYKTMKDKCSVGVA